MAMKFGLALPQGTLMEMAGIQDPVEAYETMTQAALTAEEGGFNSLWLSDAFWPADSSQFLFECWTTTAALARDTKRVRIGQMVTYSGLRQPALLAKMASTVDVMSHGRLTVGIGSGYPGLADQFRAYGYDFPDTPVRSQQLREAVQVLRAMWTQEQAKFDGKYYQPHGAINQPKGVQQPHIPLMIGGNGEQVTLKLVAQYGDACHVFGDPTTIAHKFAVLKQHCETFGRDYESIRRATIAICLLADSDEQAQARLPEAARAFGGGLVGSPDTIRKGIAALEQAGVQELVLRFPIVRDLDGLRRFAREFIA
ncbi:TIGR03560 family F420-dependent LLM class oxidoreductase [Dictyobacter formicarum]|uniref:LLM class F420-dependent oxidoreductase n=1 Tax=Dictyobacter formicarum TaxID=2778368 RepID=A0ABQ3VKI8_9CHLR|nr:TIGR03560 family F420-dependent LLM class oxidoreductase [Dictyobacter formicarum]GHO85863.1 LLM class F420-dependent oxidoreductase [Dictyobacter formicarum]